MRRDDLISFDWDKGNIDKNSTKHGISPNEAEEVFLDVHAIIFNDEAHSLKERRANILGINYTKSLLFIVFTIRNNKIRIISARIANKKERTAYEKQNA